jgi:hypothetical protein
MLIKKKKKKKKKKRITAVFELGLVTSSFPGRPGIWERCLVRRNLRASQRLLGKTGPGASHCRGAELGLALGGRCS